MPLLTRGGYCAALLSVGLCSPASAVDFAQFEASSAAMTVVLVKAVGGSGPGAPAPLLSAAYSRWDTGHAIGAGAVKRWSLLEGPHSWSVGAGVGIDRFRSRTASEDDRSGLSARLQSEWAGATRLGNYYALLQWSSFRDARLATVQQGLAGPLSLELTRYQDRGYLSTSLGLRFALAGERWFGRVGAVHAEGEGRPFVGLTYNGF